MWRSVYTWATRPTSTTAEATSRNIKWIDGLRGVASFSVVCTHLTRAFDGHLFDTRDDIDHTPRIAQYPGLRLLFQGKVGVAIFALLTGYVCALKPLRLARAGRQADGLVAISKSALRRTPRLVLPATVALLIAWTLAQFGAFTTASRCESEWMRYSAPVPLETLELELWRLLKNFRTTWTDGVMEYDDHQWALLPFLKGSFIVFLTTAALLYTRFYFRLLVYFAFLTYWWNNVHPDTETFGQQMIFGTFLVDLSLHPPYQEFLLNHPKLAGRLSLLPIAAGLFVASFPTNPATAQWTWWGADLERLGLRIFPPKTDLPRRFAALGVDLLAFGLLNCAPAKKLLSNNFFLWLGKHSFAVYLIHGTLLRTVLIWCVYGITGQPWTPPESIPEGQPRPENPWIPQQVHGPFFCAVIVAWIGFVYFCATLWTRYIDAWCARATSWMENAVKMAEGELEGQPDEKDGGGEALLPA